MSLRKLKVDRKRRKRKIFLGIFLFFILLLFCLYFYFTSSAYLRSKLISTLEKGGYKVLELEDISFSLNNGLSIKGFVAERLSDDLSIIRLEVPELGINFRYSKLWRLDIELNSIKTQDTSIWLDSSIKKTWRTDKEQKSSSKSFLPVKRIIANNCTVYLKDKRLFHPNYQHYMTGLKIKGKQTKDTGRLDFEYDDVIMGHCGGNLNYKIIPMSNKLTKSAQLVFGYNSEDPAKGFVNLTPQTLELFSLCLQAKAKEAVKEWPLSGKFRITLNDTDSLPTELEVKLIDTKLTPEAFPYTLNHISGSYETTGKYHTADFHIAKSNEMPKLQTLIHATPDNANIAIDINSLLLDDRLWQALPKEVQSVWRQLNIAGEASAQLNFRLYNSKELKNKWEIVGNIKKGSLLLPLTNIPLDSIAGQFKCLAPDNYFELHNIIANHQGSLICIKRFKEENNVIDLQLSTETIDFDPRFLTPLPKWIRRSLATGRFDGKFSAKKLDVTIDTQKDELSLEGTLAVHALEYRDKMFKLQRGLISIGELHSTPEGLSLDGSASFKTFEIGPIKLKDNHFMISWSKDKGSIVLDRSQFFGGTAGGILNITPSNELQGWLKIKNADVKKILTQIVKKSPQNKDNKGKSLAKIEGKLHGELELLRRPFDGNEGPFASVSLSIVDGKIHELNWILSIFTRAFFGGLDQLFSINALQLKSTVFSNVEAKLDFYEDRIEIKKLKIISPDYEIHIIGKAGYKTRYELYLTTVSTSNIPLIGKVVQIPGMFTNSILVYRIAGRYDEKAKLELVPFKNLPKLIQSVPGLGWIGDMIAKKKKKNKEKQDE